MMAVQFTLRDDRTQMTDGDIRAEEDRARKQPVTMTRGELELITANDRGLGYHRASVDAAAYVRSWAGDQHGEFRDLLEEIAVGLEAIEHQR